MSTAELAPTAPHANHMHLLEHKPAAKTPNPTTWGCEAVCYPPGQGSSTGWKSQPLFLELFFDTT